MLTNLNSSHIRQLRLQINLTQQELAIQCGVSRHAIIRQEQLCYPTPLPSVVSTLSDITGLSELFIRTCYLNDVTTNRLNTAELLRPISLSLLSSAKRTNSTISKHPFMAWREHIFTIAGLPDSRIHFSIMTSIHPATLTKYEAFKTGFPGAIEIAFNEMQLPGELINYLRITPAFNAIRD